MFWRSQGNFLVDEMWEIRRLESEPIENSLWLPKSYNYANIDRLIQLNWNIKEFFGGIWSQRQIKAINWWAFHFSYSFLSLLGAKACKNAFYCAKNLRKNHSKNIKTIWLLDITDREKKSFIYTFLLSTSIFVRNAKVESRDFLLLSRGAKYIETLKSLQRKISDCKSCKCFRWTGFKHCSWDLEWYLMKLNGFRLIF